MSVVFSVIFYSDFETYQLRRQHFVVEPVAARGITLRSLTEHYEHLRIKVLQMVSSSATKTLSTVDVIE